MSTGKPGIGISMASAVTSLVFWRLASAVISGLLLSCAFPPLGWGILAWFGLVPVMFVPQPRGWFPRLVTGWFFGFAHFATCLWWLNEVGFGAGLLLAAYCALYPMLWYCFMCVLLQHLKDLKGDELPGASFLYVKKPWKLALLPIAGACAWTALEWLRSMLFTGFAWNQLGISQFEWPGVIQIAAYTGVYGVSFLLLAFNVALAIEASQIAWFFLGRHRHAVPLHGVVLAVLLIPYVICGTRSAWQAPENAKTLEALVVQGNLPQQRIWSERQLTYSMERYRSLTDEAFKKAERKPQVIIWPESAIPAPLNYQGYRDPRNELLNAYDVPFMVGAIHHRFGLDGNPESENVFNSVFVLDRQAPASRKLFNPADHIVDYYDKVHIVPFGEYTPGASIFPWLPGIIGMGRDLTPGKSYHGVTLKEGVKAGVNICFEDVFAEPSRQFVKDGAQILMTITNDSWYNESAGAHQHMSHTVFRAVENGRPFLRCGSNSHTCSITPDGVISPFLRDDEKDSDFVAGARLYSLPVVKDMPMTYYTRHGDEFAQANLLLMLICLAWILHGGLSVRRQRMAVLQAAMREAMERKLAQDKKLENEKEGCA